MPTRSSVCVFLVFLFASPTLVRVRLIITVIFVLLLVTQINRQGVWPHAYYICFVGVVVVVAVGIVLCSIAFWLCLGVALIRIVRPFSISRNRAHAADNCSRVLQYLFTNFASISVSTARMKKTNRYKRVWKPTRRRI